MTTETNRAMDAGEREAFYSSPAPAPILSDAAIAADRAKSAGAEPAAWLAPTTYLQRFGDAMQLLCGTRPDDETMSAWLAKDSEDTDLQEFAIEHGPAWAQGIVVIDAARVLADTPAEGVDHGERFAAPQAAQPSGAVPEGTIDAACARVADLIEQDAQRTRDPLPSDFYAKALRRHLHLLLAAAPEAPQPAQASAGDFEAWRAEVLDAVSEIEDEGVRAEVGRFVKAAMPVADGSEAREELVYRLLCEDVTEKYWEDTLSKRIVAALFPAQASATEREPDAWRMRHRSEPGMIGHYPWAYRDTRPKYPASVYEVEALAVVHPSPLKPAEPGVAT